MGLDMYLMSKSSAVEDIELAYWRKHPNLHGYIVNTFADGVDECQPIPLTAKDLRKILKASNADELPDTQGFFFGVSLPDYKDDTRIKLQRVLALMKSDPTMTVYYEASW